MPTKKKKKKNKQFITVYRKMTRRGGSSFIRRPTERIINAAPNYAARRNFFPRLPFTTRAYNEKTWGKKWLGGGGGRKSFEERKRETEAERTGFLDQSSLSLGSGARGIGIKRISGTSSARRRRRQGLTSDWAGRTCGRRRCVPRKERTKVYRLTSVMLRGDILPTGSLYLLVSLDKYVDCV